MTTSLTQPQIELYLNGLIFSGWKSLSVTRSLEAMSGHFELGIAVRPEDDVSALQVGGSLVLKMNGQTVITGYLDDLTQNISGTNKDIRITGRDKTADLVDCSVIHHSYHFRNQTVKQIAQVLCQPFNINVVWEVLTSKANDVIKVWQVEPGETVFDTLTKLARHKGILVTSDVEGNLVFTEPSTELKGELILGQNILELEATDSWANRFSLYRVIGDAEQGGEKGGKGKASAPEDPDIYVQDKENKQ
ncbi:contractile injection system protein, VgrG/Pvc8 family [Avibacterium paragallinarum]|uniref:phage baseplate assembly protein n=1 Tax=Avibacterium paragallinarum TaxID=728 RepID=UPI0021F6BA83|nr:contractile injection system protein, VgrG/Pvc8 family [Avibacterium paragallinarum]UXN35847.1 contractile injection system protein, VgrG/Pvc8 family [Avibacterium paragallinarum]UXN37836.1 contractile injection system protein, VgrG/Pvc8 family [Avibacterium paragallinarum]